jgi:hypothetical protein
MAVPLMSNASIAAAGTRKERPPVLGSCWPSGIVSRITSLLAGVLSPVVADPEVLAPLVSPVLAPEVAPVVARVASPVVVPVDAPAVPVVVLVVSAVLVVLVPVVPVVLVSVVSVVPVVVAVVVPVACSGPGALSQLLRVSSSR